MPSTTNLPERSIAPADLKRLLDAGERVLVLDVRSSEEFADWHVPGSVNLPLDRLLAGERAPLAGASRIVTVCARGMRSARASDVLAAEGRRAVNMEGGMLAWNGVYEEAPVAAAAGVEVVQIRRVGKGCLSYLVVSGSDAATIDATVDVEVFREAAARRGARIVAAIDTHAHADHVSGSPDVARDAGARYVAPSEVGARGGAEAPVEGRGIRVGAAEIVPLATPGHTPGSFCYRLGDLLFSGDTLFVESVGRPDLGQDPRANGAVLWETLHGRILALPATTRVLPGHYGKGVQAAPGAPVAATLGDLRAALPALSLAKDAFVAWVAANAEAKPANFDVIKRVNVGALPPVDLDEVRELEAGPNRCAVGH